MSTVAPDRTSTDMDLATFMSLVLDDWEAPHCESKHIWPGNETCSHIPTHVVGHRCGYKPAIKICANATRSILTRLAEPNHMCTGCGRHAPECWDLYPIGA